MTPYVGIIVPAINFVLLVAVGLDLTADDFARVRRRRALVATGLLAPLMLLPPLALALIALFRPGPDVAAGVLLIAACPIGGISNAYSYLARASTALSITLTALSCLFASATIPAVGRGLEIAAGRTLDLRAPAQLLLAQLVVMLAVPVALGMWIRRRQPQLAHRYRPALQRLAFVSIGIVLTPVILQEPEQFAGGLAETVPLAVAFVCVSFLAGWLTATLVTGDRGDRFTIAAEFGTRNITVALTIAVTLLGRVEFTRFATTYALVEIPMMLAAVAVYRRLEP